LTPVCCSCGRTPFTSGRDRFSLQWAKIVCNSPVRPGSSSGVSVSPCGGTRLQVQGAVIGISRLWPLPHVPARDSRLLPASVADARLPVDSTLICRLGRVGSSHAPTCAHPFIQAWLEFRKAASCSSNWCGMCPACFPRRQILDFPRQDPRQIVPIVFEVPSRKLERPKQTKPPGRRRFMRGRSTRPSSMPCRRNGTSLPSRLVPEPRFGPGELFAFGWRSREPLPNGRRASCVTETIDKSKLRLWAKTGASKAYVPLPKRLAAELVEGRGRTAMPGAEEVSEFTRQVPRL